MKREHSENIELPSGYKMLEYIESTGTQYIDTLYQVSRTSVDTTTIEHDVVMFKASSNAANGKDLNGYFFWGIQSSGYLYAYMGDTREASKYKSNKYVDNKRCVVEFSGMNKNIVLDGELLYTYPNNTITMSSNIYLGAVSGYSTGNYHIRQRTFDFTISSNDNIVLHLVPALRLSDNKPGMYDLCGTICPITNSSFFVNSGTGEFLYK